MTPDDTQGTDEAAADEYRLQQAREMLDAIAAGLPEGDPLRVAIERGRAKPDAPPPRSP
ncbi:hypothetical protein [Acidibrevibacterium fodinaquatile]|uniref:hypothetical protein n=1 Tax=Acidibrevibacterium fodinaquatile TaxID=1969806 RepID=UPI0013B42823|nr:hypothetical protein [Acidibrevibacterium fodinaquatile]